MLVRARSPTKKYWTPRYRPKHRESIKQETRRQECLLFVSYDSTNTVHIQGGKILWQQQKRQK